MLIYITIIFIITGLYQLRSGIKQKLIKPMLVSLVLMLISLFYIYNYYLEWGLPGPSKLVTFIFDPLSKLVFSERYSFK